jgi:hypothetical protein
VDNDEQLLANYPNAIKEKITRLGNNRIASISGRYDVFKVINSPSSIESAIFDIMAKLSNPAVMKIPLDDTGLDISTSGVARARPNAILGKNIWAHNLMKMPNK